RRRSVRTAALRRDLRTAHAVRHDDAGGGDSARELAPRSHRQLRPRARVDRCGLIDRRDPGPPGATPGGPSELKRGKFSVAPFRFPEAISIGMRGMAAVALCVALAPAVAFGHAGVEVLDDATRHEVERHPDSPEAHLARARVLRMKQDWDAALEAL